MSQVNGSDSLSIGARFHRATSFGDSGAKNSNLTFGSQVPAYKQYPDAKKVKLPEPVRTSMALESAIQARQSRRSFTEKALSLPQVSRLLLTADGITHQRFGTAMRSAPSGGALYPIELYLVAANVEGLENGLYHFQVADSTLELVQQGDFNDRLHEAANGQETVGKSPITVILSSTFDRITHKYGDRGYRYAYFETGSISQNIYLQVEAMGLGTVAVGAFNDDRLNALLEINGISEAAVIMMPVGYAAE